MSTQILKDSRFRIVGYIETRSDGKQVATDSRYRIVGYYDPKTNKTTDAHVRIVGDGNFLSSLITSAR